MKFEIASKNKEIKELERIAEKIQDMEEFAEWRKIPATSEPGMLDHTYGEGSGGNIVPRLGNSLR